MDASSACATGVAADARNSRGVHRLDGHARRDLSRAARLLQAPDQRDWQPLASKFFYLFTCEYCFSHYVAAIFLAITRFQMLYTSWRGYLVALFALVWVANQYMSIYNRLRLDIKHENLEIKVKENDVEQRKAA